ncbi:MAG: DUF5683 domain-containing protein, partial [Saprospiraceae bacterium]
ILLTFFGVILLSFCSPLTAQVNIDTLGNEPIDTLSAPTRVKKGSIFRGRPGKAMLFSLVVPGAGQIYNKSYLRVPFVWGAVGGVGYLMYHRTKEYKCLRDAYIALVDDEPIIHDAYCTDQIPGIENVTDPARLRPIRDKANNQRQLAIIGFTVVWLLNGVDAFVDAHLKEFDIDEDLSIDIGPKMDDDPNAPMRVGVFVQF